MRLGIVLVIVTGAIALGGPLVGGSDPITSIAGPYERPSSQLWLGTDQLGRDVLARVLAGGVHLVWMAPTAAVVGTGIGAAIGLVAAYFGGVRDTLLMRLMDILLAIPSLVLALLFVAVLGPQPWLLVTLVVVALIPGVARVVRGTAHPVCTREYVQWMQAVGVPAVRILWSQVLPNITSPLLVELGVRLMLAVNLLASLSFIGYGIQPPTPDWGLMVSENRNGMSSQPFSVLAPITLIAGFTVGGNLLAEGIARVVGRTEGKDNR